jgi:hypothetical protein
MGGYPGAGFVGSPFGQPAVDPMTVAWFNSVDRDKSGQVPILPKVTNIGLQTIVITNNINIIPKLKLF